MKKLILMTFIMVGMTVMAQERNRKQKGNEMEQFTPEQQSQLLLKKMVLVLDLNDAQQKEMRTIISDNMAKKEAHIAEMKAMKEKGTKPSIDELFTMKSKALDEQIATKKRMEKILTPNQFQKWNEIKSGPQRKDHEKRPKHCKGGDPIK